MGRSQQYKERKKAFTQKKMQYVNGDQSVELGRATTSKSKRKQRKPEEECFSESSNQPDSDHSGDSSSRSTSEDELAQSDVTLARQQHTNDKLKIVMWDLQQCDPKKCSGRKLQRHGLMKVCRFKHLHLNLNSTILN